MSERYARQTVLPEVGAAGQARLAAASVVVVGAGGLGCPVLQYLAGAGVGRLTIVDHDRIEETNLHRQPLYTMADIGKLKAEAAATALRRFNPGIAVDTVAERLTPQNAVALVAGADLVVDAADSFAVTYVLSDACLAAAKPLVSASVIGMTGYVGAFCGGGPSYRAVFPDVAVDGGTCATVGVLGTAVAMLGSLQAHLALHLLLGLEPSALGRVITFDARRLAFGGFGFAGSPEPEEFVPFIAPASVTAQISWSICAASKRRRSRRSPVRGVSTSIVSRRCWRNRPRRGALSFVAAAASARLPPPTGCARAGSTIWLWWHWVSRSRRVVMTLHTTDKNVLGHI